MRVRVRDAFLSVMADWNDMQLVQNASLMLWNGRTARSIGRWKFAADNFSSDNSASSNPVQIIRQHEQRHIATCVNATQKNTHLPDWPFASINKVALHWARLVLGWVTMSWKFSSVCNQAPRSTQPGHPSWAAKSSTSFGRDN